MTNLHSKERFLKIVKKYLKGKASQDEVLFLEMYYEQFENEPSVISLLSDNKKVDLEKELFDTIIHKTSSTKKSFFLNKSNWYKQVAAAALLLLFAGLGTYYVFLANSYTEVINDNTISVIKKDLPPGGNKAILTLSNGSTIVLDSTKNGLLAQQSNTQIIQTGKGQLSYSNSIKVNKELVFNAITTPKGGEYQLILPDGTKVWLNAASSIRFPVAFVGKQRRVTITGEAYFEVAKDKKKPFIVSSSTMEVEVLGTHFNVLSYQDESVIKTTLLEGAVKINNKNSVVYLAAGQQSQLSNSGQISVKENVDLNREVAWTKGQFNFNSNTIQEIMKQLGRWYDVEVVFQGKPSNETFSAVIKRSSNISQVLKLMETSGVKFTIEGKKIYVK